MRARPSAEIRVVEVQKLRSSYDFCKPRATLCGDRARRSALAVAPCEPSAEIVRVEALSLWRRAIFLLAKRPLQVVSWFARLLSQSRGRGFDSPLVRGSSGLKIAAFKYKRSTRSVLLQLRLENRVVCGACSRSSGWKIATCKYKRSTRSTPPQLRLENRSF